MGKHVLTETMQQRVAELFCLSSTLFIPKSDSLIPFLEMCLRFESERLILELTLKAGFFTDRDRLSDLEEGRGFKKLID